MAPPIYPSKLQTLTVSHENVKLGTTLVAEADQSGLLVVVFAATSPDVYFIKAPNHGRNTRLVSFLNELPDDRVVAAIYNPGQEPGSLADWDGLFAALEDLGVDGLSRSLGARSWSFIVTRGKRAQVNVAPSAFVTAPPISTQVTLADSAGFTKMRIESFDNPAFPESHLGKDVVGLSVNGTSQVPEMERHFDLQIAVLDPKTHNVYAARGFSTATPKTAAMVQNFLDQKVVDQGLIALSYQKQNVDTPADLLDLLQGWGFADLPNVPAHCTYIGLGQEGVLPGILPELTAPLGHVAMTLCSDSEGLLPAAPLAIAFEKLNFEGQPMRAYRQACGDLNGAKSLMIDEGSGVTLFADPPTNDGSPPIFSHWVSVPDLTSADGRSATSFRLWSNKDKNRYRRSLLKSDGHYLRPTTVYNADGDGPGDREVYLEDDCLYIVRGERVSDTQQKVDLMAYGAKAGQSEVALQVLTGSDQGLEFMPVSGQVYGADPGMLQATGTLWGFILNQEGHGKFSIKKAQYDAWICLEPDRLERHKFALTHNRDKRALFSIPIELADRGETLDKIFRVDGMNCVDGEALGTVGRGSVAVFSEPGQQGRALIIHDDIRDFDYFRPAHAREEDALGRFASFHPGPNTALRLYKERYFQGAYLDLGPMRTEVPQDWQTEFGSVQVIPGDPRDVGLSGTVDLADDFHGDGADFASHRVFRATLSVPPTVRTLRLRTTERTELWLNDQSVTVGPDQSFEVPAPALGFLSVSLAAERLSCPGLLVQTDVMRDHDWAAFYPDRAAHRRLADHVDESKQRAAGLDQPTDIHAALGHTFGAIKHEDTRIFGTTGHSRRVTADAMPHQGWLLDAAPSRDRGTRFRHILSDEELQELLKGVVDADAQSETDKARGVHTWDWIVDNAHSVEQIIVHKVKDVTHSAEHVLNVAIRYAQEAEEKFENFVLSDVNRIVDLGHTIAGTLKAEVNDLLDEIKHAFQPEDIKVAQETIKNAFLEAFRWAEDEVDSFAAGIEALAEAERDAILDGLDTRIRQLSEKPETIQSLRSKAGKPDAHHIDLVIEKAQWLLGRMGGAAKPGKPPTAPTPPTDSALKEFLGVIERELGDDSPARKAITDALKQLPHIVTAGPDFHLKALLELVKHVVEAAFDAFEAVIKAIAAAIEAVLRHTLAEFEAPVGFPFISNLYELFNKTKNQQAPPEPKLIDLISLMIALPTAFISRLTDDSAPFATRETSDRSIHADPQYATKRGWGMTAGVCEILGSVLQTFLDLQEVDMPSEALGEYYKDYFGPLGKLEHYSPKPPELELGLEGLSLGFRLCAILASWPGGIPFKKFDISATTRANDPAEYYDNVTWIVGGAAWLLDGISILASQKCARRSQSSEFPYPVLTIATTLFGFANYALVCVTAIKEAEAADDGPDEAKLILTKEAQGCLSVAPDLVPWLRAPWIVKDTKGASLAALGVVDISFGVIGGGLLIYMAQEGLIDPETPDAAPSH